MSSAPLERVAYRIDEAADAVGVSEITIRRAIHATDPEAFPPPLKAKRAGAGDKAPYLIGAVELREWFDSLPDA